MQHYAIRISAAVLTFVVGMTAAGLVNSLRHGTAPDSGAAREVMEVEREYLRAHLERDVEALDRVLADDFTSFRGRVRKPHRMALVANPYFTILSLATEDVRVEVKGDEAWVTGKARMRSRFKEREFTSPQYTFTRRYERRDGRWQVVSLVVALAW
jgi:ketosteroid isomerase-like protein